MIFYIDRKTKQIKEEKIYGEKTLRYLYSESAIASFLRNLICKISLFSFLYGFYQKLSITKRKVLPFIKTYNVDPSEFLDTPESFTSFNDFFIRKLKPSCRPVDPNPAFAAIPADGRYRFFENLTPDTEILVKGQTFSLEKLLQDKTLANRYVGGCMVCARLCPVDYHRFHFPTDGVAKPTRKINGPLFSVSPIAVLKNILYLFENKRALTLFETAYFGTIAYLDVGATFVGSIHQTHNPNTPIKKGAEKGYFSFGGSALILLFEPGKIAFAPDLLKATKQGLEIYCQMGEEMGVAG